MPGPTSNILEYFGQLSWSDRFRIRAQVLSLVAPTGRAIGMSCNTRSPDVLQQLQQARISWINC